MVWSSTGCTCHRDLQLSHRPICVAADMQFFPPFGIKSCSTSLMSWYVPALLANPHRPMGRLLTCLPRLTLAQLQTLRSTIQGVRAAETLKTSHRPNGKVADVLALTLACTTSVNYSKYVPQRPASIPSPRWETHVLLVVFRAAVSGSRVAQWPSHHAPSVGTQLSRCLLCSKVPIAPLGDSRFAPCLQGGGVYVFSGTITITSSSIYGNSAFRVRAHVQKFPLPRWETRVCFAGFFCRVVVSAASSLVAQWPSHHAL